MKKLLLACSVVAMAITFVGCKENKGTADGDSQTANQGAGSTLFTNQSFCDSLTEVAGRAIGQQYNLQLQYYFEQMPDSVRKSFSKKDFLRGVVAALKTDTANMSYMMGYQTGNDMLNFVIQQNSAAKIDVDKFIKYFSAEINRDSVSDGEVSISRGQMQQFLSRIHEERQRIADEARQNSPEAVANKNAGEKAVADAKAADPSIKTSESGLSYKVITPGEGEKVAPNSTVKVIYTGTLVDGTVFDSSNGEPAEFNVNGVVPGFKEGLQLLAKGGKARLYVPGNLAYGVKGIPQAGIGPNAMLVFDIEVVDVVAPEAQQQK